MSSGLGRLRTLRSSGDLLLFASESVALVLRMITWAWWTRRSTIAVTAARSSPDYSWMGVWRMSGDDHRRTLTRKYSFPRFLSRSVVKIYLLGERWVSPNTRLDWRYMPRCVGNLNNQG